jgi:hypothetical protein
MTARIAILVWMAGTLLLALSTLLQYWHLPYINFTRMLGIGLEAAGVVITVVKVLRYPGARPFLER